jgi:hypothetical protein
MRNYELGISDKGWDTIWNIGKWTLIVSAAGTGLMLLVGVLGVGAAASTGAPRVWPERRINPPRVRVLR